MKRLAQLWIMDVVSSLIALALIVVGTYRDLWYLWGAGYIWLILEVIVIGGDLIIRREQRKG